MSDPCRTRFTTWIDQKIGGAMLGEVVVAFEHDAALAQVAALREELAHWKHLVGAVCATIPLADTLASTSSGQTTVDYFKGLHTDRGGLRKRLTAAEQRNAELEKDAARYLWLRDKSESVHQFYLSTPIWFTGVKFNKVSVDSTIDAALKSTESGASDSAMQRVNEVTWTGEWVKRDDQ